MSFGKMFDLTAGVYILIFITKFESHFLSAIPINQLLQLGLSIRFYRVKHNRFSQNQ